MLVSDSPTLVLGIRTINLRESAATSLGALATREDSSAAAGSNKEKA